MPGSEKLLTLSETGAGAGQLLLQHFKQGPAVGGGEEGAPGIEVSVNEAARLLRWDRATVARVMPTLPTNPNEGRLYRVQKENGEWRIGVNTAHRREGDEEEEAEEPEGDDMMNDRDPDSSGLGRWSDRTAAEGLDPLRQVYRLVMLSKRQGVTTRDVTDCLGVMPRRVQKIFVPIMTALGYGIVVEKHMEGRTSVNKLFPPFREVEAVDPLLALASHPPPGKEEGEGGSQPGPARAEAKDLHPRKRRMKIVQEVLEKERLMTMRAVSTAVRDQEAALAEGGAPPPRCDRKSILRVLFALQKEGKVKVMILKLPAGMHPLRGQTQFFVVATPDVTPDDEVCRHFVDKLTATTRAFKKDWKPKTRRIGMSIEALRPDPVENAVGLKGIMQMRRDFGTYTGQMQRVQAFHKFLWQRLVGSRQLDEAAMQGGVRFHLTQVMKEIPMSVFLRIFDLETQTWSDAEGEELAEHFRRKTPLHEMPNPLRDKLLSQVTWKRWAMDAMKILHRLHLVKVLDHDGESTADERPVWTVVTEEMMRSGESVFGEDDPLKLQDDLDDEDVELYVPITLYEMSPTTYQGWLRGYELQLTAKIDLNHAPESAGGDGAEGDDLLNFRNFEFSFVNPTPGLARGRGGVVTYWETLKGFALADADLGPDEESDLPGSETVRVATIGSSPFRLSNELRMTMPLITQRQSWLGPSKSKKRKRAEADSDLLIRCDEARRGKGKSEGVKRPKKPEAKAPKAVGKIVPPLSKRRGPYDEDGTETDSQRTANLPLPIMPEGVIDEFTSAEAGDDRFDDVLLEAYIRQKHEASRRLATEGVPEYLLTEEEREARLEAGRAMRSNDEASDRDRDESPFEAAGTPGGQRRPHFRMNWDEVVARTGHSAAACWRRLSHLLRRRQDVAEKVRSRLKAAGAPVASSDKLQERLERYLALDKTDPFMWAVMVKIKQALLAVGDPAMHDRRRKALSFDGDVIRMAYRLLWDEGWLMEKAKPMPEASAAPAKEESEQSNEPASSSAETARRVTRPKNRGRINLSRKFFDDLTSPQEAYPANFFPKSGHANTVHVPPTFEPHWRVNNSSLICHMVESSVSSAPLFNMSVESTEQLSQEQNFVSSLTRLALIMTS
jgi:hypothetical protein